MVNYSASAACDECSGSSHNEFVAARPCETSIEAATLAAGWAKNYVQAVSVYALHPHRTSTKIPFRLCFHSFCSQWQIPTEVYWLSGFCQEQEQDLVNMASFTRVQPPGTLFHLTFTTLLIWSHSENDSRMYFLIVLILLAQISHWLIDSPCGYTMLSVGAV